MESYLVILKHAKYIVRKVLAYLTPAWDNFEINQCSFPLWPLLTIDSWDFKHVSALISRRGVVGATGERVRYYTT